MTEEKGGPGSGRTTGTTGRPGRLNKFLRTGPFSPSKQHRQQFSAGVRRMGKKELKSPLDAIGLQSKAQNDFQIVSRDDPQLNKLFSEQREFWNRAEKEKRKVKG